MPITPLTSDPNAVQTEAGGPYPNDEPKQGMSVVSEDPPGSIKLRCPMDDGHVVIVDLRLSHESQSAAAS